MASVPGKHRTTGLEPLTQDLQAEFVKTAERAQVGGQEGCQRQNSVRCSARALPWS
jgi:hypothetical protein